MAFKLTSSAFHNGEPIPATFTCEGENIPPPLAWSGAPEGTRSFALIMDDPDAPGRTFTHWLLHDVPGDASEPGQDAGKTLRNSFGRPGYGGPCPPPGHGPHRYFFTLYALDVPVLHLHGTAREALERALHPHVLGTAQLMGRYERRRH